MGVQSTFKLKSKDSPEELLNISKKVKIQNFNQEPHESLYSKNIINQSGDSESPKQMNLLDRINYVHFNDLSMSKNIVSESHSNQMSYNNKKYNEI